MAWPGRVRWPRNRIQAVLDGRFQKAQGLPQLFDEVLVEEGKATVKGRIR